VGASVGALEVNYFGANPVAFAVAIFFVGLLLIAFRLEKTAYRYASIILTIIVRLHRGQLLGIGSLKSQLESSLLSRSWRCGRNSAGCQSVAPPNSTSFAIASGLAKEIIRFCEDRVQRIVRFARAAGAHSTS
jgi:hypothetical protein